MTPAERFWSKVEEFDGCWLWLGTILRPSGYGQFHVSKGNRVLAHRFAYADVVGAIPEGLTLDHLCRNRACVNPTHLEPVTQRENTLRGLSLPAANAAKTHCVRGHEFTVENTYLAQGRYGAVRHCRQCRAASDRGRDKAKAAERQRRYMQRRRQAA